MLVTRFRVAVFTAVVGCVAPCFAADDWAPLLNCVPDSTNALVLIDAEAILASPIAVKENWINKQQANYAQGTATLPPGTLRALFAANLEPTTMRDRWELGLVVSKNEISAPVLARLEGGSVDTIADQSVVLSPRRNAYFADVAPRTVGIMYPANRQELARWLRLCKKNSPTALSNYLRAAVASPAPLTIAIDMADVTDANQVGIYLSKATALKGKNVKQDDLKRLLAGLRGLTLSVRFADSIQGQMAVDFNDSPQAFAEVLKPLILETLGNFGCMIDSLAAAETKVNGKSFVLSAEFTPAEVRRLLMLVHPPTPSSVGAETAAPQSPSTDPKIMASKRYFSEIDRCLQDLTLKRKTIENEKQWNMWHDKYAEEIDRLPVLNVDRELLDYGTSVSGRLRTISVSVKGVAIKTRAMEYGKRGGWDYYGGYYSNSSDVEEDKANERAKGQLDRLEIWKSIEEDEAAIRKRMIGKYRIDF